MSMSLSEHGQLDEHGEAARAPPPPLLPRPVQMGIACSLKIKAASMIPPIVAQTGVRVPDVLVLALSSGRRPQRPMRTFTWRLAGTQARFTHTRPTTMGAPSSSSQALAPSVSPLIPPVANLDPQCWLRLPVSLCMDRWAMSMAS